MYESICDFRSACMTPGKANKKAMVLCPHTWWWLVTRLMWDKLFMICTEFGVEWHIWPHCCFQVRQSAGYFEPKTRCHQTAIFHSTSRCCHRTSVKQLFSFNFGPQLRHTAHAYSYDEKTAVRSSPNLPCFRITTVDILLHLIRCLLGARSVNSLVVLSADWRLNHCALTLFHSV